MKKGSINIAREDNIVRFLNGDLSESEKVGFENWIKENPDNFKIYEETKKIWDASENLDAFHSVDINGDWLKVKGRLNTEDTKSFRSKELKGRLIRIRRIAAIIIIMLAIGFLLKEYMFTSPEMIAFSTGDYKNKVMLPDGSIVFLNKYSMLEYPEKFQRKLRYVRLTGEGYFDVTPDPNKIFRINIDDQATVEVLGTSFNIRSDRVKESVDVRVLNGRVAFFTPETESNKTILAEDEKAILLKGSISKEESRDINFMSWKTGVLDFESESIENVLAELSRFYNKEFVFINKSGKDILFTSRFENQELNSVLEEIRLVLNLDYVVEGEKIIFHDN